MSLSTLLATAAGKAAAGTAIAVLAAGGVAAADAVDLPSQAEDAPVVTAEDRRDNEHRRDGEGNKDAENEDETEEVETEELETEAEDLEEGPSVEGEENSMFGDCVSDAAATAPENGGQDWNPTDECIEYFPGQDGQAVAAEHRQDSAHRQDGTENGAQGQAIADQHRPAEFDEGTTETVEEEDDEDGEDGPSGRGAEASAAGQANRP